MLSKHVAVTLAALALAGSSSAATIWAEGTNGDLSGNRLAPTSLSLATGTNTITGSSTAGDIDYFTFTIPAGKLFTQIILTAYSAADVAFLGMQSGSVITEDPATANAANLMGYLHIGQAHVGTDILDNMAASNLSIPAAQGFTTPLGPGSYAFWLQQGNASPTNYTISFVVTPEPSLAALLALGLGGLALRRRS